MAVVPVLKDMSNNGLHDVFKQWLNEVNNCLESGGSCDEKI